MGATGFSMTAALPPIVRVSRSTDAPLALVPLTAVSRPVRTVRIIGAVASSQDTQLLSEPKSSVRVVRGRRAKAKRK
jgi:hypothetical protein